MQFHQCTSTGFPLVVQFSPVWTSTAADRRRVRFEDSPDQGEKMDSEMIKGQNDSTENKDNPEMNEKLNGMNDEPSKWQENEVVFAKSSKGYPTWPATIVKMHASKKMFLVEYFDTLNWAVVTEDKIFKYEDNVAKQKIEGAKSSHKVSFERALKNAQDELSVKDRSIDSNKEMKTQMSLSTGMMAVEALIGDIKALGKEVKAINEKISHATNNTNSWAKIVGDNPNAVIHQMVTETRKIDQLEQKDQEYRSKNIIIHQINEEAEETKDDRIVWFNKFAETLGINVTPKEVIRIGKKSENMTRPIKVVLENTDDKEAVLKNLRKLATATLELKRIRVTEDHTKAEREQIKQKVNEAKHLNESEKDATVFHKLVGSPKNGLRIIKVEKRQR